MRVAERGVASLKGGKGGVLLKPSGQGVPEGGEVPRSRLVTTLAGSLLGLPVGLLF